MTSYSQLGQTSLITPSASNRQSAQIAATNDLASLAGDRYDLCLVFPYKTSSDLKYGEHSDSSLIDASSSEKEQMDVWTKKRNKILQQILLCGIYAKAFYSRERSDIYCKIGTDVETLMKAAERCKYKLQLKEEYLGAYAPFMRDFPGTAELNYADRKKTQNLYRIANPSAFSSADCIFRTVDRIHLINYLLTSHDGGCAAIDIGSLLLKNDIKTYFPLHEPTKLDSLNDKWWNNFVTIKSINNVTDYFGEHIGFYFVLLSHISRWLVFAGIIGLVFLVIDFFSGSANNFSTPTFCFLMSIWIVLFPHFLERKTNSYALAWGVFNEEDPIEQPRPEFVGIRRIHPVTEKQDLYYPWQKKVINILITTSLTGAAILIMQFVQFFILSIIFSQSTISSWGCMIIFAATIQFGNVAFSIFARALNNWENWRTDSEYQGSLIVKVMSFKFFNSYGPLYYIAFMKNNDTLYGTKLHCNKNDCISELSSLLFILFFFRLFVQLSSQFLQPNWVYFWNQLLNKGGINGGIVKTSVPQDASAAEVHSTMISHDPYDNMDEVAIQFGYVALFVVAVPWLPAVALVSNILQIYIEKDILIKFSKRSMPKKTRGNASWTLYFSTISWIAAGTNVALLAFATSSFKYASFTSKLFTFVILEHLVVFFRIAAKFVLPSIPEHVTILYAKHKRLLHKYFDEIEEEDEAIKFLATIQKDINIVVLDVDDDEE